MHQLAPFHWLDRSRPILLNDFGRNAACNRIFRHILGHDGSSRDYRVIANGYALQNGRVRTDPNIFANNNRSRIGDALALPA